MTSSCYRSNKRHYTRILNFCCEWYYTYSTLLTNPPPFPPARVSASKALVLSPWPIQPWAGRFTVAARIGEILPSVDQPLSRDVLRVNTGAHTRGRSAQRLYAVSCIFLFLCFCLSFSLVYSEWTMDGIAHQPARSWFSCSLGVTCPRRISTVTFYRFLRSPPSTFTVKTADFQQRALSRGTYCVPCKTSVDSRRIETKFRESVCESRLCTNMCASHLCFTGSVCLACWWPINVWTY